MKKEEARLTLQANVIYACEVAGFGKETIGLIEEALDIAIEALQAKTDGDLIRRQDAINTIRREVFWCDELIDRIKSLPSADRPSGEWIPIEEREPDTADHVLVTARWDDLDYEVFELDYGVTKALAYRQGYIHQDYCKNLIEHIIAWQYKPEPYKGV